MRGVLLRLFDPMFGHPRGLAGRIGGAIMERANAGVEHHVVGLAKPRAEDMVLVVGPGPGIGLRTAAQQAHQGKTIGVDPSEVMLDKCRQHCGGLVNAGRVELRQGTAAETGQSDASVDVVISVNNVFFWPDRGAGFAELFRVLRPGGRLVMSMHNEGLRGIGLTQEQLRTEVEGAGFDEVRVNTREHASLVGAAVELLARKPE